MSSQPSAPRGLLWRQPRPLPKPRWSTRRPAATVSSEDALCRLAATGRRPAPAVVTAQRGREQRADQTSQNEEDDRGQVVTEHDESLYHRIEIACNNVLLSDECGYLGGVRTEVLYP